jgi:hypothetical protein
MQQGFLLALSRSKAEGNYAMKKLAFVALFSLIVCLPLAAHSQDHTACTADDRLNHKFYFDSKLGMTADCPPPTDADFAKQDADNAEVRREQQQQREAEEAKEPKLIPVTAASGVPSVPGALVCSDYSTLMAVVDEYQNYEMQVARDAATAQMPEQSRRLLYGDRHPPPPAPPDLSGCTILPAGTPMMLERSNAVPVVKAQTPDGRAIEGVTAVMMTNPPAVPEPEHLGPGVIP